MQALFFMFGHLHKLCKHHFFCFGICISYASIVFYVLPFAEAPQAPIFLFCHLRKLRKRQFFCFDVCGSSASTKFFVLTFAEAPQALKFLFYCLRKLRKHSKNQFYPLGRSINAWPSAFMGKAPASFSGFAP